MPTTQTALSHGGINLDDNFSIQLSIVIPVFNEQDNVFPLVQEIQNALATLTHEIILVDDASTDETPHRLHQLKIQYPSIKTLRHQKNSGQSAALVTGIKSAKYSWIATLDGDGQNNPTDILNLIQVLKEKSSSRNCIAIMGHRTKRKDNTIKKLSSQIANRFRSWALKDNCPDTGCGLKLFPRDLFIKIPHFRNCHRFLPALFKRAGAEIINVSVSHRERRSGVSKYGIYNRLWVGIIDILGVSWLIRRNIEVKTHDDTA